MARYFVRDGKSESGPYSGAELKALVDNGTVTRETLLRQDGTEKCIAAGRSKALFPEPEPAESDSTGGFAPFLAAGSAMLSAAKGMVPAKKEPVAPKPVEPPPVQAAPSPVAKYLLDGQSLSVVEKIIPNVTQILTRDEQVEYIAIQARPLVNFLPDSIVITNRRFMLYRRKMLGQMDFSDWPWRDLRNAKLVENMIGATISLTATSGEEISLDYLPREQARQVYRICQEREEAAVEERRNRKMEESRAAAGGVVVQAAATPAPSSGPAVADDPMAKLGQLKNMADAGLITAAEYEAKKADILSRM